MQQHVLSFSSDVNVSLQVGDVVFYSTPSPTGGFSTITNAATITTFGVVTGIYNDGNAVPPMPLHSIVVIYDDVAGVLPPVAGDYIMFAKNKEVNSSSLKGYYAEVRFENWSTEKVELFSIGSEVSESSK